MNNIVPMLKDSTIKIQIKKDRTVWRRGENPYPEIRAVESRYYSDKFGPTCLAFHFTTRGRRELMRRNRNENQRQRRIREWNKKNRGKFGCDVGWFLFGP